MKAELLISGVRAVLPDRIIDNAYLAVADGKIAAIGSMADQLPTADKHTDANGALLFPGLIDTHVHFREPGLEHKATIASESRAALAGGITAYVEMPNTKPPTVGATEIDDKRSRAAISSAVDYAFFPAASPQTPELLRSYPLDRIPGIKLFLGTTTGAMAAPAPALMEEIFRMCHDLNLPIMVHAEDDAIIAANTAAAITQYGSREAVPVDKHYLIRSREACLSATAHAVELAHRFGTRLHIAHISTADEVREFLSAGSPEGKLVTAETTPLYLDPFIAKPENRTCRHKINPAIKTDADAEVLRQALIDGRIDTLGTDHAPHQLAEKQGGALTAASGAPSVQFALPILLNVLSPETIARTMALNPALIFGLRDRGTLTPDMRADFSLVEHTEPYEITDAMVISPCGWTPFAGLKASHRVASTHLATAPAPLSFSH